MGRRLLRGSVKLGIIAAVVGGLVIVGKKLMGGLGPEPGSELAPKEWPSLVPEPTNDAPANGNGAASSSNGAAAETAADEATSTD